MPFFAVGGIFAIITYVSQSRTSFIAPPSALGLNRIVLVFCHNIIFYLYKIIWPINLSPHYAYPEPLGLLNPMVLAGFIGTCILITLLIISLRWTPAVLTAWLVFFVAIFPTMGVIGFTNVIASDKFAYLPSVGLLMVLASLLGWFCSTGGISKHTRRSVTMVMVVLILAGAETVATRRYLVHWYDTESLCEYILTLTPDAVPVRCHLGSALESRGELDRAIGHYRQALQIKPDYAKAHNNLGTVLSAQGKLDEAISYYRQALQTKPDYADAHYNLGRALQSQGKLDEAISHYRRVLQLKPNFAAAHSNLGIALTVQGKLDEAIIHYRHNIHIEPNSAQAHCNLGSALSVQGKLEEAISHYRQALQIKPDYAEAHYNLGLAYLIMGDSSSALEQYNILRALNENRANRLLNLIHK